ncbi:MAG: PEGA domain-containing protein [Phycisphaerae bacterium]|nr:PEGA domain-containing protein [Phycisphaerae bacterium]
MRNTNAFSTTCLWIFAGLIAAPWGHAPVSAQGAPELPPLGAILVDTAPVDGRVFIDGKPCGTAPVFRAVSIGKHVVSFGDVPNYTKPAPRVVKVRFLQLAEVTGDYTLNTGVLLVDTTPIQADVYVDGTNWGEAPESNIMAPGSYSVTFGDVPGYVTPPGQVADVVNDKTTKVIGTYQPLPPDTGILSVDTIPIKGDVFVDGVSWGTAPETKAVSVGEHVVSFSDHPDYVTPEPITAGVEKDKTTQVVADYVRQTGTLSVMTTPVAGEVFVDDESWGIAPQARLVDTGTHTITFGQVDLYVTPPSQTVSVAYNEATVTTGTYVLIPPLKGHLAVDTSPINAEVFVNGESWGTSPVSRAVDVGNYTVSFADVDGYVTPEAVITQVEEGRTTSVAGTYTPLSPDTGVLVVLTAPVSGQVIVDGDDWGVAPVSRYLDVGTHSVQFGRVAGYVTPLDHEVNITENQTEQVEGTYTPVPPGKGTLAVDTSPPKGEVIVDGVSWGTAPETDTVDAGSHTVRFGQVPGFITPDDQVVNVTENETTSVSAVYKPLVCVLNASVDGKGEIEPPAGEYLVGETVVLLALPNTGNMFHRWEGDVTGSENPRTLKMNGNKTVKAVFGTVLPPCCGISLLAAVPLLLFVAAYWMAPRR